jgi:hypothetical protein
MPLPLAAASIVKPVTDAGEKIGPRRRPFENRALALA